MQNISLDKSFISLFLFLLFIVPLQPIYSCSQISTDLLISSEKGFSGTMHTNNEFNQIKLCKNSYSFCFDTISKNNKSDFILFCDAQRHNANTINKTANINVQYPLDYDIFRAGDTILINGTIDGERFKNYMITYGVGRNPLKWYTTGITLINNGISPVQNATLAVWNTSHIKEPDFFTLKITLNLKKTSNTHLLLKRLTSSLPLIQGNIFSENILNALSDIFPWNKETKYIRNIYLDPTLKKGWPHRLDWLYYPSDDCYYWPGMCEAVVSDIDNDTLMEIIVYMGGNPPEIHVFDQDGNRVEGWPVELRGCDLPGGIIEAPTVADIDNDGFKEIIANGENGLSILNHDGSFSKFIRINSTFPSTELPTATIVYDLDNDGNAEIMRKIDDMAGSNEKIALFDSDGTMLQNWPQTVYHYEGLDGQTHQIMAAGFGLTQAIGNFDEDPEKEIVVASCRNEYGDISDPENTFHHEGRVYVFNLDGTLIDGFPVDIDGEIVTSSPAVGDIDNDGWDDIIVATSMTNDGKEKKYCNPNTGLYVLDRHGQTLTGWPQLQGKDIASSPALADFNDDGYLEIVVSTLGMPFKTYVFDYKGTILPGWPQETSWNDYRSPVVGDVNGDGYLDVITTAGSGIKPGHLKDGGVYAWNIDGTLIEGFPKVTEIDAQAAATIADIDNDGNVELIASSNYDSTESRWKYRSSIYVWELNTIFDPKTMEWPMYHHDTCYTGQYVQP